MNVAPFVEDSCDMLHGGDRRDRKQMGDPGRIDVRSYVGEVLGGHTSGEFYCPGRGEEFRDSRSQAWWNSPGRDSCDKADRDPRNCASRPCELFAVSVEKHVGGLFAKFDNRFSGQRLEVCQLVDRDGEQCGQLGHFGAMNELAQCAN